MKVIIKEDSLIAGIAAKLMRTKSIAIVFGHTIHLWNTPKQKFLSNSYWLRHELMHIQQYNKYGFTIFLFLYLKESIKSGYYKNRFEKEARDAEVVEVEMKRYEFK